MPTGASRWLFCRMPRRSPRVRVFAVPFAGAGASVFNAWSSAFPETVELHAVQLPGRESRYAEAALGDVDEAVRRVADAMEPCLDRCYAVFGYSMGALLAFEIVRELRRRRAPLPVQLFVAARRAPQLPAPRPLLARLSRDAFLKRVTEYYDSPAVLQNRDLLEIILPVLRADVALCEGYVYRREPPFDFPMQAFAGQRDASAPLSAVQGWREQTTAGFSIEVFEGGHFFFNASPTRVQQAIISRLEHYLRGATSS